VASVTGGECHVFERPEYAIKGATHYDQRWADGNTEAGVGACGWERPKPRPPELDQAPAARSRATSPARAPKVSLRTRVKRFIVPSAAAAPAPPPPHVEAAPAAPEPVVTTVRTVPVEPPPDPPPPPPPPDPLDELIGKR
jgi:hypothetical protein